MKNKYEIRGDVTDIFISSPKHGDLEVLINTNKLERVQKFPATWCVHWSRSSKSLYVVGWLPISKGTRKQIQFHRWVTDCPDDMVVDHINHDGLNNTDDNLRVITPAQNRQNIDPIKVNASSGIRGVTWNKKSMKWRAHCSYNGTTQYFGEYENIHDAEQAAIQARMKYMPFSNEPI